ncbi:MAG: hypothetical protein Q9168_008343 [Polycauliona sp. 1 TL-2023]
MPAWLHLSNRNPILSSATASPLIRMDEEEYREYKLAKQIAKQNKQESKRAEKKRKEIEGVENTSRENLLAFFVHRA